MKLYKNSNGVWAGTQADARKMCGKDYQTVDVPVDKPSLLRFLNANKVGAGADPYGDQLVSDWYDKTRNTTVDDNALSYFRWGYDKLFTGQYDEGKELIKKALEMVNDRATTSDG
jgi:hypothetical protein